MLSSSLEAKEKQDLLSTLGACEFVLALSNALDLGSILGRCAVRKLRGPDQCLKALRLQDLDRLKVLGSLELSRGHLAQEPPGALLMDECSQMHATLFHASNLFWTVARQHAYG